METKGFYIVSNGDPTVGIFRQEWKIEGGFFFDSYKEFEDFIKSLKETWEQVSDDVFIETFEEREFWIQKENELFDSNDTIDLTQ